MDGKCVLHTNSNRRGFNRVLSCLCCCHSLFLQDSKCFLHTNSPMASPSSRTDPVKIRSTATTTLCELVSPTVSWKLASRCRSIPLSPPRAITETGRRWSGHVTHTCFVWLCHIRLFFGVWSCHTFVLGQAMSNVFVCVFWSGHVIYIYFLGPVTSPMFFCLVVSHVFWVGHVIHVFCLFGYVTFFGLVM